MLAIHYYKENEDEFTKREIEPYRLANGPEGWYVASYDRRREDVRHFRLDRIKEAKVTDESFEPRPEFADIAVDRGRLALRRERPRRRRRAGLGLPRARPLGPRGAHRRRGAHATAPS